jgi:hypothetical protein
MNQELRSSRLQRRSVRIPLRVRLTIRFANDSEIETETIAISRYGAKVHISAFGRPMICGDHVQVCLRGTHTWRAARIAWIDHCSTGYCGLELQDPENFWGVFFPERGADEQDPSHPSYTPLAHRAIRDA